MTRFVHNSFLSLGHSVLRNGIAQTAGLSCKCVGGQNLCALYDLLQAVAFFGKLRTRTTVESWCEFNTTLSSGMTYSVPNLQSVS
jgi:hypothetical protein